MLILGYLQQGSLYLPQPGTYSENLLTDKSKTNDESNYGSHFNTWQSGHITVLLCSCPYMAMLPSQVT